MCDALSLSLSLLSLPTGTRYLPWSPTWERYLKWYLGRYGYLSGGSGTGSRSPPPGCSSRDGIDNQSSSASTCRQLPVPLHLEISSPPPAKYQSCLQSTYRASFNTTRDSYMPHDNATNERHRDWRTNVLHSNKTTYLVGCLSSPPVVVVV
ncbi:hypothetical protein LZ30DRAFT_795409 [Colletotrichum cereale]|nr:hypothetical protein LZ30DRAFT_795409 [Colletotrichum cereale]